jgi:hypothetical protein
MLASKGKILLRRRVLLSMAFSSVPRPKEGHQQINNGCEVPKNFKRVLLLVSNITQALVPLSVQ